MMIVLFLPALPCRSTSVPVPPQQTVYYRRARFTTRLPTDRLYTPAHYWLRQMEDDLWQIGLTKFATRMLGDLVEHQLKVGSGAMVQAGDTIGWIEGFKAVADIYCVANGEFEYRNPALDEDVTLVDRDVYDAGWLYAVRGTPDHGSFDVDGYVNLLDRAIDRILRQQASKEVGEC